MIQNRGKATLMKGLGQKMLDDPTNGIVRRGGWREEWRGKKKSKSHRRGGLREDWRGEKEVEQIVEKLC